MCPKVPIPFHAAPLLVTYDSQLFDRGECNNISNYAPLLPRIQLPSYYGTITSPPGLSGRCSEKTRQTQIPITRSVQMKQVERRKEDTPDEKYGR